MFSSGLVTLCSWIHSTLFCKQGFAISMSYIFVLRDTDQTIPLHEYAAHCCQPLLFRSMTGTSFLPRSTVSLLISFTLIQASATTSHSIMPSRGSGKFTCLGLVRGCLIGLASLMRFSVLWFMEWIIIKLSTELLKSFPYFSLQVPSMVPAYYSHSWVHCSWSSNPQLIMLKIPHTNIYCVFLCYVHGLSKYMQHIERNKVFWDWLHLRQKDSGIHCNTPQICFVLGLHWRWRANSCLFHQWSSLHPSMQHLQFPDSCSSVLSSVSLLSVMCFVNSSTIFGLLTGLCP